MLWSVDNTVVLYNIIHSKYQKEGLKLIHPSPKEKRKNGSGWQTAVRSDPVQPESGNHHHRCYEHGVGAIITIIIIIAIIAAMNMVGGQSTPSPSPSPSPSPGPTPPFSLLLQSTCSWAKIKVCASLQNIAHIAKKIFTNHEILAVPSFQHNCILFINDANISVVGSHCRPQYFLGVLVILPLFLASLFYSNWCHISISNFPGCLHSGIDSLQSLTVLARRRFWNIWPKFSGHGQKW